MLKLINSLTGTEMFVADDRIDEYLSAGHVLADNPPAKKTAPVEEKPKEAPKKTYYKATTKKSATSRKK